MLYLGEMPLLVVSTVRIAILIDDGTRVWIGPRRQLQRTGVGLN
jgi:hypothetical protein